MDNKKNIAVLAGTVASQPTKYEIKGETFYDFLLKIKRASGNVDTVNVNMPTRLRSKIRIGDECCFTGEIRSYDRETDKRHLHVCFLAQRSHEYDGDINHVELTGIICKEPRLRDTPSGRRICDLMLANNRSYGHTSYLPTLVWGDNAVLAGKMNVGTQVAIEGRFQSREYKKTTLDSVETLVAYEISASRISLA